MPKSRRAWFFGSTLAGSWLLLIGTGIHFLYDFASTPGTAFASPAIWPPASHLQRQPGCPTLVLVVHPRCPCSSATISELEKIISRTQGRLAVRVLFVRPHGVALDWEKAELWQSAQAMPGVLTFSDPGGAESRLFGALTSGHAVLYDAGGRLAFAGGLTWGRGHAGDNPGSDAVLALVLSGEKTLETTPVYGCPLERQDAPGGRR